MRQGATAMIPQTVVERARRELARRCYADYCAYVHRGAWRAYAVHRYLCKIVDEIIDGGKHRRVILSMPPRHGKSNTISETLASYYLCKFPNRKVIITSKDEALATRFGGRNRDKVRDFGSSLFGVDVKRGSASKTRWETTNGGELLAAPILGGITGSGAHLMIIDDPVKNRQEADSKTMRDKIWEEWNDTLKTRVERDGVVIVIMTRWHEDDLAGRLLAHEEGWEEIRLPLRCEDPANDPLGRKTDEFLCPQLGFDDVWFRRSQIGGRTLAALYQQRPTPQEGGLFRREWFKRYDALPDGLCDWSQSWDLALTDTNDYVAGGVWARKGGNFYLVNIVHERIDFGKTLAKIQTISAIYPQAVRKIIENKANGVAAMNMLRQRLSGIQEYNPRGNKEARASAILPFFEAGNVYVPLGKAGDDYIEELCAFPHGAHDDMVDMTSQYLARYTVKRDDKPLAGVL